MVLNESGYFMRSLLYLVIISIAVFSCDAVDGSFDEAVPGMYTLQTGVTPDGSGSVEPSRGDYITGERVRIEAIPESGYVFDRWDGDHTGNSNPVTLTLNRDMSVTALFSEIVGPYLEIIQQPVDIEAGQAIYPAPEVKYYDVRGDPAGNIEIQAKLSHEAFLTESETSAYTNDEGIAVFENLIIDKANSDYTILFEVSISDTLNAVSAPFTVKPSDVNSENSKITATPSILEAGQTAVVYIELRDRFQNLVGGLESHDFEISVDDEAIAGNVTETADPGIYQFDITNEKAETVSVTATVQNITIDDILTITFKPGKPDSLEILVQPENTNSGEPIKGPPTVQVKDQYGNYVNDVNVRVRENNDRQFRSGTLVVATDESGIAVFDDLVLDGSLGNYRLVFSVEGLPEVMSDTFRVRIFGLSDSSY
jgi:hypothetical protein